jgi:selenium metabolism protein YedF
MQIVDTRGQLCPAPLIATKRALQQTPEGETIQVLTDNPTSFNNLSRFLRDNNPGFTAEEKEGIWTITITKKPGSMEGVAPEAYCTTGVPHFRKGDFVIAISSDKMGDGDAELGTQLMANFIKAIKDLDLLPGKMVFYNRGVLPGMNDSPVAEHLREIESMGVTLLFCATCINHYKVAEKISIGNQSNMFEIAQIMASASNVVKP